MLTGAGGAVVVHRTSNAMVVGSSPTPEDNGFEIDNISLKKDKYAQRTGKCNKSTGGAVVVYRTPKQVVAGSSPEVGDTKLGIQCEFFMRDYINQL